MTAFTGQREKDRRKNQTKDGMGAGGRGKRKWQMNVLRQARPTMVCGLLGEGCGQPTRVEDWLGNLMGTQTLPGSGAASVTRRDRAGGLLVLLWLSVARDNSVRKSISDFKLHRDKELALTLRAGQ